MANKYTAHPIPPRDEIAQLYASGLTQEDVGRHYGVTQKVVYTWFKKLKLKARIPIKVNQAGELNSAWKGDRAGYAAMHYRVQNKRGKPMVCSRCTTTDAKRYEWASLTKNYGDPFDYIRLCKSCHATFDGIVGNLRSAK